MVAKYFSIIGFSGSGKTFVIQKIINFLKNKGFKVGVCKYIHHPGFGIDIPDKDTTKYYENGAKIVSYVSPEASGIIYIEKDTTKLTLRNIENKVDYLILEGFKDLPGIPQIALIKDNSDLEQILNEYTVGVSSHLIDLSKHELFIKIEDIPALVEKKALQPIPGLNCKKCGYDSCEELYSMVIQGKADISKCINQDSKVNLLVNDEKIPLNKYVEKVFHKVLRALIETLERRDKEISSIEINIQDIHKKN